MSLPTVKAYTLQEFSNEVKVEIYKRIQSDHEGEMTEDDFNELLFDIKSEELDDAIDIMYNSEVDRLLCEYHIADAVALYISTFGWDKESHPTNKMYLYTVIDDNLNDAPLTHDDYLYWCENHCEDEEEEGEEELNDDNVVVSGIACKTCKFELPEMKMSEHLDKNNPKNKCKC